MKKRLSIILTSIVLLILLINIISSQTPPALPDTGVINPETGKIKSFEKFKEAADNFSEEEERKAYTDRDWTKLLAKYSVLGPLLFYTESIFAFFNPLWEFALKTPFSWSWKFILSLTFFIAFISFLYRPIKDMLKLNPILSLITSIIITTLIGVSGGIEIGVTILTPLIKNIWILIILIIIIVLIIMLYQKYFDKLKEKSEEDELEEAELNIKTLGRLSKKELEDMS